MQKEYELQELEIKKQEEAGKRELIEREKARLIKENEEILKTYFAKGYDKAIKI